MFSRLREHFGAAGLAVAIIALIAALAGGAVAATGGSSDGKATASATKGKPGPRGKTGKPGPQGPAGPAGAQGPAGAPGAKGDAGAPGANGANGANGLKGATGPTGPTGEEGEAGEPGILHPGETLPSEATETGTWRFVSAGTEEVKEYLPTPISFPIPLSAADAADTAVKFVKDGASVPGCPGTPAFPEAEPGFLCIYGAAAGTTGNFSWENTGGAPFGYVPPTFEGSGVGPTGTVPYWEFIQAGSTAAGSFAVTAPS
jgi:hypothetical protein